MPAAPEPRAPGPFAFADTDYVTSILTDAGFGDIVIEPTPKRWNCFPVRMCDAAENFARINPIISAFMTEAGDDKAEPLIDGLLRRWRLIKKRCAAFPQCDLVGFGRA